MLIKELEKMQSELDINIMNNLNDRKHLLNEAKYYYKKDFLSQAFLALNVEIGEFLDTTEDKERLEELVDILHFILSLKDTLQLKSAYDNCSLKEVMSFAEEGIAYTDYIFNLIINLSKLANMTRCFKYWSTKWNMSENKGNIEKQFDRVLIEYLGICNMLYSPAIIEDAYQAKYNKNLERQREFY